MRTMVDLYNDGNECWFQLQVKMPKRPNKKGMVLDVDPLWAAEHQGEEVVMEDAFAQEVRHDAVHPFCVRSFFF